MTIVTCTVVCAGQIYSVNDARYFDWPEGLRRYIDDIRQGKGQNPKQYSARYICSLVADFHRSGSSSHVMIKPHPGIPPAPCLKTALHVDTPPFVTPSLCMCSGAVLSE